MLYLDINTAIARVQDRASLDLKEDREYIIELLEVSYGLHKQTRELVYRPFWVAAKILEQSPIHQTLKKDDSTEFTGQAKPIDSLLELQSNLDNDLDVRPGFGIAGSGQSSLSLQNSYDRAILFLRQYLPRGYL